MTRIILILLLLAPPIALHANESDADNQNVDPASLLKELEERMDAVEQNLSQHDNCETVEARVDTKLFRVGDSCVNQANRIAAVQCPNGKFMRDVFIKAKGKRIGPVRLTHGRFLRAKACVFSTTCCN